MDRVSEKKVLRRIFGRKRGKGGRLGKIG